MDVHPTKNGINRYWSIPTWKSEQHWMAEGATLLHIRRREIGHNVKHLLHAIPIRWPDESSQCGHSRFNGWFWALPPESKMRLLNIEHSSFIAYQQGEFNEFIVGFHHFRSCASSMSLRFNGLCRNYRVNRWCSLRRSLRRSFSWLRILFQCLGTLIRHVLTQLPHESLKKKTKWYNCMATFNPDANKQ